MTRSEAESLLYHEARLLDERRFEQWLALFANDCLYWVPTLDGDPAVEPSLIYDDHARMEERVARLIQTRAHAQDPPSRTQHNLSNVEVVDGRVDGPIEVLANLLLVELRPGGDAQVGLRSQRLLAARCQYYYTGGPDWRIRLKKVSLLDRDLPHYNLSFLI